MDSSQTGLSPRVRGNQLEALNFTPTIGSIPACAGEPFLDNRQPAQQEVYPRVCGGTRSARGEDLSQLGLSPRVRGNPGSNDWSCYRRRSIPACAGEPGQPALSVRQPEVYPRVCGGTIG